MKKQLFCLALSTLAFNAYGASSSSSSSASSTVAALTDAYKEGYGYVSPAGISSAGIGSRMVIAAIRTTAWSTLKDAPVWHLPNGGGTANKHIYTIPAVMWGNAPTIGIESVRVSSENLEIKIGEADRAKLNEEFEKTDLNPLIIKLQKRDSK